MPGDRVVSVCCAGSGHHYLDPRGDAYENDDSTLMLCRMRSGRLVKIRVDMISDRPPATNYQLQGTKGCYESARGKSEKNRIWIKEGSQDVSTWTDLEDLEAEFLPEYWRLKEDVAAGTGHGGGDFFEILDFVDAIRGEFITPIGIHEAMDITLPGLVSQQSILDGERWMDVPDSREW